MRFQPPDTHDRSLTPALHEALRKRKVRALHALIKKGVYVDSTAFELARGCMPEKVETLVAHQRKTFYG